MSCAPRHTEPDERQASNARRKGGRAHSAGTPHTLELEDCERLSMLSSAREPKLPEPASRRDPASQPSRSGAIAHPARWNRERSGAPPERVHSARKASAPGEHTENARSTPSVVVNDIPVSCCACAACQIAPTCEHSELVSAYNRARTGSNRAGNLSTQGTWSARRRRRACDAHKSSRDANSDPRAGADVVEPSGTSAGDAGARHRGLSSPREEVFGGEKTRLKPGQNRLRRVQRRLAVVAECKT